MRGPADEPRGEPLEVTIARLRAEGAFERARDVTLAVVRDLGSAGEAGTEVHTRALLELGRLHDDLGDYEAAQRAFDEAAQIAEGLADGHGLAAIALARRAGIDRSLTRLDDAERAMARADSLALQALGADDPWRIEILAEAALLRIARGDLELAEALVARALEAAEAMPDGLEHAGALALVLDTAGTLERTQGRYDRAAGSLLRALALAEAAFGPGSLEVVQILNNLGITFKFAGRFREGEVVYRRALDVLEGTFGESHPDVAAIYHNLGGLGHARGDYAAAEPYARRSVEIRERTLGPDHPVTALDRAAHAAILDRLGRSDEAEASLRAALAALTRTLGTDNHEVAAQLNNLAAIVQRKGALDEAEGLYRHALAVKERVLGPQSAELATSLNNLGTVLRARGKYREARRMYGRALALLEAGVEPTHPTIAVTRANLAKLERLERAAKGARDSGHT